jgi:hypothetical protein
MIACPGGEEAARPPQDRFALANMLAIERLQALGLSCFWAAAIPVLIFQPSPVLHVTHHSPAEP